MNVGEMIACLQDATQILQSAVLTPWPLLLDQVLSYGEILSRWMLHVVLLLLHCLVNHVSGLDVGHPRQRAARCTI